MDTSDLHDTQKRLAHDVRALIRDAEDVLEHRVDQAGAAYDAARERLSHSVKDAKAGLSELETALMDRARDAARATDHYVRAHPWESIGVTAGIGLLIGLLIGRK
jgi:ElaB/YqjD/DUF883 family membrane-anchored ribosome-binding protein